MNRNHGDMQSATTILRLWGASEAQIRKILPKEYVDQAELLTRMNSIIGIFDCLQVILDNPDNQIGFMLMVNRNDFFDGRTPMEVISSGSLQDLVETEFRIRYLRQLN